mgnify:FL=1
MKVTVEAEGFHGFIRHTFRVSGGDEVFWLTPAQARAWQQKACGVQGCRCGGAWTLRYKPGAPRVVGTEEGWLLVL